MMRKLLTVSSVAIVALTGCLAPSIYLYQQQDVSIEINKAAAAFDEQRFEDALDSYYLALESEPKSMEARLGAIRAQLALRDYKGAAAGLETAALVDAEDDRIYELYARLARESGKTEYASVATELARSHGKQIFLDLVPAVPEMSLASGTYDSAQVLEINGGSEKSKIYYRLTNESHNLSTDYVVYAGPISLPRGTTIVEAYVVEEGIASGVAKSSFTLAWAAREVAFKDPFVEAMVRATLGRLTGPLTEDDLESVESISTAEVERPSKAGKGRIETLEDVAKLPNLKKIYADAQTIVDLAPLTACPYLVRIDWTHGRLTNLDFASGLSALKSLIVSDNQISDVSGLSSAKLLRWVDLSSNPVSDLSPLFAASHLSTLGVDDRVASEVTALGDLENLSIWGFNFNHDELSGIQGLKSLKLISKAFAETEKGFEPALSDLSFLESMTGLEELTLYCVNDAAELEHVKGLSSLKKLKLLHSGVTSDDDAMAGLKEALPHCQI